MLLRRRRPSRLLFRWRFRCWSRGALLLPLIKLLLLLLFYLFVVFLYRRRRPHQWMRLLRHGPRLLLLRAESVLILSRLIHAPVPRLRIVLLGLRITLRFERPRLCIGLHPDLRISVARSLSIAIRGLAERTEALLRLLRPALVDLRRLRWSRRTHQCLLIQVSTR